MESNEACQWRIARSTLRYAGRTSPLEAGLGHGAGDTGPCVTSVLRASNAGITSPEQS